MAYGVGGVDVEAQQRPQQGVGALAVAVPIVGTPAVAQRGVEVAVGSEGEHPAVVVAAGLALGQQDRGRLSGSATSGSSAETRYSASVDVPPLSVYMMKNLPLVA